MPIEPKTPCVAFKGVVCVAKGGLKEVASWMKANVQGDPQNEVLIFDNSTGKVIDVDFRGSAEEVGQRIDDGSSTPPTGAPAEQESPRGPGRPKLGVVAREVTLLPRHWDWLGRQPGGASVALRKLVEQARRDNEGTDRVRQSQEASYRFMSAMAGNLENFEEASRSLFAGDGQRFEAMIADWPVDIRDHAKVLAGAALQVAAIS